MENNNLLLLNPPANKVYIRDYFCSKVSRSDYLFPPVDLLMLSGQLSNEYNLKIIDAIVDKMSSQITLEKIKQINPKIIISLVGAVCWEEDFAFLRKVREETAATIICIGDVVLDRPRELLGQHEYIDGFLFNFSTEDLSMYLKGDLGNVRNMVIRVDNNIIEKDLVRDKWVAFDMAMPRHDLFKNRKYRVPFAKKRPFSVVLTDFGCPFDCPFCIMATLGYRYRNIDNILNELEYIDSLGVKELFFIDQSFGVLKERNSTLYKQIIERKFNFGWTCFSRVDLLNEDTIGLMKKAGCHTIIIGVESGDKDILKIYKKGYDLEKAEFIFSLCRKMKIRTVATFMLGLPEDTRESCLKTIEFSKRLACDFSSFHVAVPRASTPLREKAIQMSLIEPDLRTMDQGGSTVSMPTKKLNKKEIACLKKKAVREFYLRPGYLFNRLTSCGSFQEMWEQAREGFFLLKG